MSILYSVTLSFLLGVLLPHARSWLFHAALMLCTIVALIGLCGIRGAPNIVGWGRECRYHFLCCGVFVLLGSGWFWFDSHARHIPPLLENQLPVGKVHVLGSIASLPSRHYAYHYESFLFDVDAAYPKGSLAGCRLQLRRYGKLPPYLSFRVGDHWSFWVRLKSPRRSASRTFDPVPWLWQQGIQASGYIVSNKQYYRISGSIDYRYRINRIRQTLRTHLQKALRGYPMSSLLIALVLGDHSGLSREQWQVFRRTGTSHLMAISGLHVGLVAGFLGGVVLRILRYFPSCLRFVPAMDIASCLSFMGATLYSFMAGFSVSTQRAWCMIAAAVASQWLRRPVISWRLLCYGVWGSLLINPISVLSASFWLSFTAVCWIFYAIQFAWFRKGVWRIQALLSIGMMPMTFWFFHQISGSSFLANLVAVPWVSFIVVPLSLLGTIVYEISSQAFLLHLASYSAWVLYAFLHYVAELPWVWKG